MPKTMLFVDIPNVITSLRKLCGSELNVSEIVGRCGGWNEIAEVRAYADVTMLTNRLRRHLDQAAVTLVHVRCRKGDGTKESDIDFALAADLVEVSITRQDIERVVLVGGDGDFFWALSKARRFGKGIGVVAVRGSLSRELAMLTGGTVKYLKGRRLIVARGSRESASSLGLGEVRTA